MDSSEIHRPLRADARRNRELILKAAAGVFARDGLQASLDDIAAEAGVGVGTVYRRFPERQALIDELFEEKIAEFVRLAEECGTDPDPFTGLVRFMTESSRMHSEDLGLRQIIMGPGVDSDLMNKPRQQVGPLVNRLIEGAKANGDLRDDFEVLDVPMIGLTLAQASDLTRSADPDYWRRILTLVIDGLRPVRERTSPMPTGPLTPEKYQLLLDEASRR